MNRDSGISDEYLKGSSESTSEISSKSDLKEFLKKPVSEENIIQYGTSKPTRKILRAKIVNDKN